MTNEHNKDAIISAFGGIDIMLHIIMESDYIMDEAQMQKIDKIITRTNKHHHNHSQQLMSIRMKVEKICHQ